MGLWAFFLSAALLLYVSRVIARRLSDDSLERYWLQISAAALQLGAIASLLTAVHRLNAIAFLATQIALALIVVIASRRWPPRTAPFPPIARQLRLAIAFATASRLRMLLTGAIVALIVLSGVERLIQPVFGFDDRMYHASRAAYWLQHQSLLAWQTHNDRQTMFPLSAELIFFWPLLFMRSEAPAMLVFWLAYPLTALGVFQILRMAGQGPRTALAGSLIYCATPIVLYHTNRVHPDLWMTLYCLGTAFWAVRAALGKGGGRSMLMAGVFAGLAFSTRATALPIVISVIAVVPWLIGCGVKGSFRAMGASLAGVLLAVLLGGSSFVFAQNVLRNGHPLGSSEIRTTHSAALSARQLKTHAVRFAITLLDVPFVTSESLRRRLETSKHDIVNKLSAGQPLVLEGPDDWPGPQPPQVRPASAHYSLVGWLWLPAMVAAGLWSVRDVRRTWPRPRVRPEVIAAVLAIPMLLGGVFIVRWMDGIERFWVAPFVLSLFIIAPMCGDIIRRWPALQWLAVILLGLFAVPAGAHRFRSDQSGYVGTRSPVGLDEPFFEPFAHVQENATLLLFMHGDARDYPLFNPRTGFTVRLISWGKRPFNPDRLTDFLETDRHPESDTTHLSPDAQVTHVLFQDSRALEFHWDPPLKMTPFVQQMRANRDFVEIPLHYSPGMRLFQRSGLPMLADAP